jgi:hypothetical protein
LASEMLEQKRRYLLALRVARFANQINYILISTAYARAIRVRPLFEAVS